MKTKVLVLFFIFFQLLFGTVLSQSDLSQKQEFTYKTIDGHEIKANIFLPKTNELHPVVIYFHGGGFIFGNKDEGLEPEIKNKLLDNNYAVVSADYRLAPETKLGEIISDVNDVVKWIRNHGKNKFKIDTDKIAVAGGSSGGYLALSTGFDLENAPNAIVAISTPTGFSKANIEMGDLSILNQSGPYDIVSKSIVSHGDYGSRMTLWRFLAQNRLALYEIFGFDPSTNPLKLDKFTLTNNIQSDFPPTLIIHAEHDRLVDIEEANAFYRFLQDKKIETKLFVVANGHSSELIRQYPAAVDEIVNFLTKNL